MANFNGTANSDFIHVSGDGLSGKGHKIALATNLADTIDVSQGGDDNIHSGDGDDTIVFGAAFTGKDKIDGQGGANDTVTLNGNYAAGVTFGAATMVNVEKLTVAAGNNYKLKTDEATIVSHGTMTFDASALGSANTLSLDASKENNGTLIVMGGAGDDVVKGGNWANGYHFEGGGHDTAVGGIGADGFYMAGAFDANDRLNGGGGIFDTLFLDGNYGGGVRFKAHTLENCANVTLAAGHNYKLITHENTVATAITFDAHALGAGNKFTLDASAETTGTVTVTAGAGDDALTGGNAGNVFTMTGGGNDTVKGGAGHDQFNFNGVFTLGDHIDGGGTGATDDLLIIGAVGPQSMTLGAANVAHIGTLQINGGAYTITAQDDLVAAGKTMTVTMFTGSDALSFDGSAETNGAYILDGGSANDVLKGGSGNDTFKGRGGHDAITLGGGADSVAYSAVAESTGTGYDTVTGFDFSANDKFDMPAAVGAVDTKIGSGFLDAPTFDANLATATSGKLAIGHAVIFTPDSGNLAGHTFLVIDANGSAGYQAGADYVIELAGAVHVNNADGTDFT